MSKRRLSCSRLFCSQGCTSGSWADSWLPYLDRSHKANLTHSGGVFQRGRCFKIHSLSQMEPKFPSQLGLTLCGPPKTSPASILLWGSNGNAPQPSPSPTLCICKWEHSSLPQIGDLVRNDQLFCLNMAEYGFEGIPFDGILVLNYPNISFTGAIPIFTNLKNKGAISEPVFAFYLSK